MWKRSLKSAENQRENSSNKNIALVQCLLMFCIFFVAHFEQVFVYHKKPRKHVNKHVTYSELTIETVDQGAKCVQS